MLMSDIIYNVFLAFIILIIKQIHLLTWKTSLAHFLQRLCWQGRMTTGFVNISRHMGQISCFSKFSMLFILWRKLLLTQYNSLKNQIRQDQTGKRPFFKSVYSGPTVRLRGRPAAPVLAGVGCYLGGVSSVFSIYCCHVKGCHFYLVHIWNWAGPHRTAAYRPLHPLGCCQRWPDGGFTSTNLNSGGRMWR